MDHYFNWLLDIVDCPEEYTMLMERLYTREFTSRIPNDGNRIGDGIGLRHKYCEEFGEHLDNDIFMRPCSVLEMMVALACRIEDDIMHDLNLGDRTPQWFWIMISNLDLDGMTNDHYDIENVNNILNVMIDRSYAMNGSGGLFPLKRPKHNQRRVEIWYQMCQFLEENFENDLP